MKFDCLFLGNNYLFEEIPKEKRFLLKYFKGEIQQKYIRYILFFGDDKNFMDHTGIKCTKIWLKKLENKYKDLVYLHGLVKSSADLETLSKLESGELKVFSRIGCKYDLKKYLSSTNI